MGELQKSALILAAAIIAGALIVAVSLPRPHPPGRYSMVALSSSGFSARLDARSGAVDLCRPQRRDDRSLGLECGGALPGSHEASPTPGIGQP